MTTDIENELRELFRDKAGEAPLATPAAPATAPPHVLRRGRRRQLGTVLGSLAAVVVVVAGSVAGLQRLLADGPEPLPPAGYDVFERTATVEAFTVTSPSDWYLVNRWPLSMQIAVEGVSGSASFECQAPVVGGDAGVGGDVQECEDVPSKATLSPIPVPQGLPMIQLTNVDLGLDANACEDGIPDSGATLYVALDAERAIAGIADPTIPPFPPGPGLPSEGDGPCGPGRYTSFTVNGEPFFAWIGLGSAVSDQDRETVETAYEQMSAIEGWTPIPPDHLTPSYVIAGGATDQYGPWRIEVRPSAGNVEMTMIGVVGVSQAEFAVSEHAIDWCCEGSENGVLFGAIQKGARGVEFQPDDGRAPITGTIAPMPPTLGLGFDVFFLEGAEGLTGEVVAVGLGSGTEASPSPQPEPAADVVSLSGGNAEHTWIVRFTGSFIDDSACIRVRFDSDALDPACPTLPEGSLAGDRPSLHGWLTDTMYLLAGVVPLDVEDVRFVSDDGGGGITELQCTTGPTGWTDTKVCALTLPPEGSGTIRYLDDEGNVLFEEGMGWGAAEASLPPGIVDPVHGGTYWAVYPWIGSPGAPEADLVSAQLIEQFGIEAFPGELGCDQGAAEALGRNDAEHAIGVYFETEEDANRFAQRLAADTIGDPMVAQVTAFCLD